MSTNPPYIAQPFANNADPAYIFDIPDAPSATPGKASLSAGFPPLTMTAKVASGVPPFGQDFNGILKLLSQHIVYLQDANLYTFSQDFVDGGGLYNTGNTVISADGSTLWMCNADSVSENPDDATASRWTSIGNTKLVSIPVTGGTVALTALQTACPVLVFTGVLTSNVRVNLSRHQIRQWVLVNQTTGPFTVTVGTSAGTGILLPAGGFPQPTGVYSDGTNVYPNVSPFAYPLSTIATPNTVVLRDNSGNVFAAQLNQSSATENPTIDSIFCQAGGDGYLRKLTKADFAAQMPVASFAGRVADAQVGLSSVAQWASSIFASAALTGNPTAPTAAVGDSDTTIATTAFANPLQLQNGNGYVKLPGGILLQWGSVPIGGAGAGSVAVTYPIAFPGAVFAVNVTTFNRTGAGSAGYNFATNANSTGFTAWFDVQQTGANSGQRGGFWFAVGV